MRKGYGKRIYRRRKKPTIFIIAILAIVLSYFFFTSLNKDTETTETSLSGKNDSYIQEEKQPEIEHRSEEKEAYKEKEISNLKDVSITELKEPEKKKGFKKTDVISISNQARDYYIKKDYKRALELFKKIPGKNINVLLYIGLCQYWLADYDMAHSFLLQILNKDSSSFDAKKYLALTSYKVDDLKNSLMYAEDALKIRNDRELLELKNKLLREKKVMKEYTDAKKPNFKIQFSKFEHGEIKEIVVDILKEAFRTIGSSINSYPKKPITVILYNERGFFDVTRAPGWAGGLYDGKIRIPIKGAEKNEKMLKRILYHEYTHALIRSLTHKCPLWINEGMAEYFSISSGIKIGQLIPFNKLNRAFYSKNLKVVALAYMESYSAVSYLIDRYGLYRLKELLLSLGQGNDLKTAFRSIYFISFDQFAKSWGKD